MRRSVGSGDTKNHIFQLSADVLLLNLRRAKVKSVIV